MEHYELEDLFGRRLRPSLSLYLELRPHTEDGASEELHFWWLNEGRGLARHAGFLCKPREVRITRVRGHGLLNASGANQGAATVTYYDPHQVIHANDIFLAAGHVLLSRERLGTPLAIDATWYAEDMVTRRASASLQTGVRLKLG